MGGMPGMPGMGGMGSGMDAAALMGKCITMRFRHDNCHQRQMSI